MKAKCFILSFMGLGLVVEDRKLEVLILEVNKTYVIRTRSVIP